jgi:hypothetical protein
MFINNIFWFWGFNGDVAYDWNPKAYGNIVRGLPRNLAEKQELM